MRCTRCGSSDAIEIRMHVDDQEVQFHRCPWCEAQGWAIGEDEVDLTEVLKSVRK